jgi:hypothetical protein
VPGAGGGSSVYVQDTPPTGVPDNSLWWESDSGLLYVRYNDGDSTQWVIAAPVPDTSIFLQNTPQTLTTTQQTQSRANIYAAPFDALAFNGIQINGSMDISQENGATARTTAGYVVDGWKFQTNGPMVVSAAQVADAPPGYSHSIKVSVTTAEASLGAADYFFISQPIEGIRTSRLAFGMASAQPISIGFWTKIHRPGPYSGAIRNGAATRSYVFSFTQNAADTWEYKTVTIPGDVTGAWVGFTNASSLEVDFTMATGTTFAGAANTWAATNYIGVTGTTNGVAATTDTFQIAGVVVLPGIELPSAARAPFIMRLFDQDLMICQRYYEKTYPFGDPPGTAYGSGSISGGGAFVNFTGVAGSYYMLPTWSFRARKRALPTTVQCYSPVTGAAGKIATQVPGGDVAAAVQAESDSSVTFGVNAVSTQSGIAGHMVADARL